MTPKWFEHATFWSGVRRATVAPRSRCTTSHILRISTSNLPEEFAKAHFSSGLDYFSVRMDFHESFEYSLERILPKSSTEISERRNNLEKTCGCGQNLCRQIMSNVVTLMQHDEWIKKNLERSVCQQWGLFLKNGFNFYPLLLEYYWRSIEELDSEFSKPLVRYKKKLN